MRFSIKTGHDFGFPPCLSAEQLPQLIQPHKMSREAVELLLSAIVIWLCQDGRSTSARLRHEDGRETDVRPSGQKIAMTTTCLHHQGRLTSLSHRFIVTRGCGVLRAVEVSEGKLEQMTEQIGVGGKARTSFDQRRRLLARGPESSAPGAFCWR